VARQLPKFRPTRDVIALAVAVGIGAFAVAFAAPGLATIVSAPQMTEAANEACNTHTVEVAAYQLSPGDTLSKAIDRPLAGRRGDPERGIRWVVSPQRGHCIACHAIPSLKERIAPDDPASKRRFGYHGTIGPSLEGVAGRYSEGELRLLIVDPRIALPAAVKPAYHSVQGLRDVAAPCVGQPVLSGAQVEDIVAFLKTLK